MSFQDLQTSIGCWDFDPLSQSSAISHRRKLIQLRKAALDSPVTRNIVFCVHILRHDAEVKTDMRPLPLFAHSSSLRTVTLEAPLQTTPDAWSQIWIARVASPEANDLGRVILKFSQPSMIPIPDLMDTYWMSCTPPRLLARQEDYIYRMLLAAQGSAVLYYFGLHDVTMPNGEVAYLLAMEYIEGITVAQWTDSLPKCSAHPESNPDVFADRLETLKHALVLVYRSMTAIHASNVIQVYTRGSNMIMHPSAEAPTHVILVDFGLGRTPCSPQEEMTERRKGFMTLFCCKHHSQSLREWTMGGLPADLNDSAFD
ncbi:hypothetical protein BV25DRAFT_1921000 [Artomyces pyxidatus]|uniref:Uncharacterized protein n=1 Tax=Artomyces pyxidatus TaxID=48021 RepID=A0ACB8SJ40_9AGAM|nr:hypothetical protein BV25DRAFT_1921000 [Artomyces pyxidatus]